MALISLVAVIHFVFNRSVYSLLMLLYFVWPAIFKFIAKHLTFNVNNNDAILDFLVLEKLVTLFLLIPIFIYVLTGTNRRSNQKAKQLTQPTES